MSFSEGQLHVLAKLHHQAHAIRPRVRSITEHIYKHLPTGSTLTLADVRRGLMRLHARSRVVANGGTVRIKSKRLRALLPLKSRRQPERGKPRQRRTVRKNYRPRRRLPRVEPIAPYINAKRKAEIMDHEKASNPGPPTGLSLNFDITAGVVTIRGDRETLSRLFAALANAVERADAL